VRTMDPTDDVDPELQEIRKQRLQQLQSQQQQSKQESQRSQDEQRKAVIAQLLTPDALERLNRIALVKPDNARLVENSVLMQYQQGRIREKVDENQLKTLLSQISGQATKTTVQINRRKNNDDEDNFGFDKDDDDDDD